MSDDKTIVTKTPSDELADKIARGELVAGGIIAEFANGHDAANFARSKGYETHTVTPGINLVFAVRPWITVAQKAAARAILEKVSYTPAELAEAERVRKLLADAMARVPSEGSGLGR